MSDKNDRGEPSGKPGKQPPPVRPSAQQIAANIDKWANSSGLQKPT